MTEEVSYEPASKRRTRRAAAVTGAAVVAVVVGIVSIFAINANERADDRDVLACAFDLAARTTIARAEYLSSIGDLVVAIATTPPAPADARAAAVAEAVELLDARNVEYRAAARAEAEYNAAGRPSPCPTEEP